MFNIPSSKPQQSVVPVVINRGKLIHNLAGTGPKTTPNNTIHHPQHNKFTLPLLDTHHKPDERTSIAVLKSDVMVLHKKAEQLLGKGAEMNAENMERVLAKYNYNDDRQKLLESKISLLDLLTHKMVQVEAKVLHLLGGTQTSSGDGSALTLAPTSRLRTFLPILDKLMDQIESHNTTTDKLSTNTSKTVVTGKGTGAATTTQSGDKTTDTSHSRRSSTLSTDSTKSCSVEAVAELEHKLSEKMNEMQQLQQNLHTMTDKYSHEHTKNKELAQQVSELQQQQQQQKTSNPAPATKKCTTTNISTQTTNSGTVSHQHQPSGLGTHKMHVELTRKQTRVDELTKQVENLISERDALQKKHKEVEGTINNLTSTDSQQQVKINELHQQLQQQEETFALRLAEKDEAFVATNSSIASQYQSRIAGLEETSEHQKRVIEDIQCKRQTEQKKLASQQAHISELLQELSQQQELTSQVETLQSTLQHKTKDFEKLNHSNMTRASQLVTENKQLHQKLTLLTQQMDQLQAKAKVVTTTEKDTESEEELKRLRQELEDSTNARLQLQTLLEEKMEYKDTFEQVLFNELKTMRSAFLIQINQYKIENEALRKAVKQLQSELQAELSGGKEQQPLVITRPPLPQTKGITRPPSANHKLAETHLKQLMGRCATAEKKERPVVSRGGSRSLLSSPAAPNPGFGL
eukprot:NODE_36_length_2237_cov_538.740758_g35_i0.p1 GENE.NODE_36_length_2237_cov_538.740758_g35_i0~~NODE_36_length_2237_cov_538.740758_g35_i0.p1  ORF type:complete len:691 (+),score=187.49 NODE_36_length_2237_cov_538.740758_g35_i0:107-2179(+)